MLAVTCAVPFPGYLFDLHKANNAIALDARMVPWQFVFVAAL